MKVLWISMNEECLSFVAQNFTLAIFQKVKDAKHKNKWCALELDICWRPMNALS